MSASGAGAELRDIAQLLIATPSVSPDPDAEGRCGRELAGLLPDALRRGEWQTPDGRPVVWGLLRGRSPRTVVLLGHYDTVGIADYARLGLPGGEAIAFDPDALRAALLERAAGGGSGIPADALADLAEERAKPGTWMFGRGALDMKSGLAAGIGALRSLAADQQPPAGSVLFVACPDEECASAGMKVAVREMDRLRESGELEPIGLLNLDYGGEPVAWSGVMGKALAGVWVLGRPTHAGAPLAGVDAAQIAAAIASRAAADRELVDRAAGATGPPPVILRLRDLKTEYNLQTAIEAVVELNLITLARSVEETFARLRRVAAESLAAVSSDMAWLAGSGGPGSSWPLRDPASCVLTFDELTARAAAAAGRAAARGGDVAAVGGAEDARALSLERLRALAAAAGLSGPAVVLFLLPPFYPHASPGRSPFAAAVAAALARRKVELRAYYPFVTDAAWAAWRGESEAALARYMPALGIDHPPIEAARALDLDAINLGPWGRDAHGPLERVHARHAFETLPGLIVEVVREALKE